MKGRERDRAAGPGRIRVGRQRHRVEVLGDGRAFRVASLELPRGRKELLEVLAPRQVFAILGAGVERAVAGHLQQMSSIAEGDYVAASVQVVDQLAKARQRRRARSGSPDGSSQISHQERPDRAPLRRCGRASPRPRRAPAR